jgi:VanZ family protein
MMRRWLPVIAWAGFIFTLSSIPNLHSGLPDIWDLILRKIGHMAEFGVLARLVYRAWPHRLGAGVCSVFYAITDELHQRTVPGRHGSILDVLVDSVGILFAIAPIRSRLGRSSQTRLVRAPQNTRGSSDQA